MLFIFTRFINSCMIHNFVASGMLAGVIRPIIKNNQGNVRDSENYREVMISSNFFQLLEHCLVPFIKCADLCPAQFGYRSNTSTTLAEFC